MLMLTYSGRKISILYPGVEDINIEDIAHALSLQCRYNGHCNKFYSVAEHSILAARMFKARYGIKFECDFIYTLMHDAAEAYLGDIVHPIKSYLGEFKQYEENLLRCIANKFNLCWPVPKEIKEIDVAILHDESIQVMASKPQSWSQITSLPLGIKIFGLEWQQAIKLFLVRYDWIK